MPAVSPETSGRSCRRRRHESRTCRENSEIESRLRPGKPAATSASAGSGAIGKVNERVIESKRPRAVVPVRSDLAASVSALRIKIFFDRREQFAKLALKIT